MKIRYIFEYVRSYFAERKSTAGGISDEEERVREESLARHYLTDFGDSMLKMAYSYLHNYADAEEVVQDALIKVLRADPTFENDAHAKAYLLTTVANLSKNRIDFNRIRATDELSEELVHEEREDLSFVWEAVKKLSPKYSEVIFLFYQEGYQTAEIARILGRKESTIRSDLNRARAQLKDMLREEYDF